MKKSPLEHICCGEVLLLASTMFRFNESRKSLESCSSSRKKTQKLRPINKNAGARLLRLPAALSLGFLA